MDGEEAITLMADLDAGATGAMTGAGYPDGIRTIVDAHVAGDRAGAVAAYQRWLPLINYENRQCGLIAAKGVDAGRRRHSLRDDTPSGAAAAPGDPRRTDRDRPTHRSDGAAVVVVTG
jgi:hypothetical protein